MKPLPVRIVHPIFWRTIFLLALLAIVGPAGWHLVGVMVQHVAPLVVIALGLSMVRL